MPTNPIMMRAAAGGAVFAAEEAPALENTGINKIEAGENMETESISLLDWFMKGGLFMWPLLLCAAAGMGFIIERYLFYRKININPREFITEFDEVIKQGGTAEAEKLCAEKNILISRILLKGLHMRKLGLDHVEKGIAAAGAIETASLEKGLTMISSIGNIAPLLGFLGTVSGMIGAFQTIAAADQISARLVAGGIFEALITTEAGLIVAIPMFAFSNYFTHRIDSFVAEIERLASDIVETILREDGKDKAN
ncbi:MAG: hypothetical protein CVV44_21485 [Spirochaetae bacterium HGW-Spirochaetae-1]|jgi:biopolymer transport protein ExbB|nr:MAG: hypothetical protein CVV44_21485 [Spirochaetae bacterium HGW-Spirochaetae-1]